MKHKCKFFLSFVLLCAQVHATTQTQYAEMATALATIPFDIAAQHATLKNKQPAVLLHITAETIGILNKILFLHNNIQGQKETDGDWTIKRRDFVVNGLLLARGLIKLDQQLRILMPVQNTEDDLTITFEEPVLDGQTIGEEQEQEISKLAYAWQVVALPSLKGLTAFALACTQDDATKYDGQQARNLATAANSLVNMAEAYTELKPDSGYKKLVAAILFINTAWLVYELRKYIAEMPAPYVPMKKVNGHCEVCMEDGELLELQGCGHTFCKACFTGHIDAQFSEKRAQLDQTRCLHHGCEHTISKGAMAEIVDDHKKKDKILAAYDNVVRERKKKKRLDDAAKEAIRRLGAKPCPKCQEAIEKNMGCDHMKCKCGHDFWWTCGGRYYGMGQACDIAGCTNPHHPRPGGGFGGFGGFPW